MVKPKKHLLSYAVYKYPYCAKLDGAENYLSDKVCQGTIKIRKKTVRKTKRVFVYLTLILSIGNGLAPAQAIGLPILMNTPAIMKFSHSSVGLPRKVTIAQIIKEMSAEIDFTETEINQLYTLGTEWRNKSLTQEELINKISNLRGGEFIDVAAAIAVMSILIILLTNDLGVGFQPLPPAIVPPNRQLFYGNNNQQH